MFVQKRNSFERKCMKEMQASRQTRREFEEEEEAGGEKKKHQTKTILNCNLYSCKLVHIRTIRIAIKIKHQLRLSLCVKLNWIIELLFMYAHMGVTKHTSENVTSEIKLIRKWCRKWRRRRLQREREKKKAALRIEPNECVEESANKCIPLDVQCAYMAEVIM